MARIAKLKIRKLKDGRFMIEEPTELHNGKRVQKTFTSKARAELHLAKLKVMKANYGVTRDPYKLLDAAGFEVSLLTVVEEWIASKKQSNRSVSLEALFEEYITTKEKAHPKYLSDLRQTLKKFTALKPMMVSNIGTTEVEQVLAGATNGTRNNALKNIRTVFDLRHGPWHVRITRLKRPALGNEPRVSGGSFRPEKVQMILDYALEHSPEIVPYLAILFFCGIRPDDEALALKWSDIDQKNMLWVAEPKIGDGREIPLSANALDWINAAKGRYTFQAKKIMPLTKNELSIRRKAAYAYAGYKDIPQDGARHSFASYWLPVNESNFGQLMVYMGHTTIDTLKSYYRRHATKEAAERYWQIRPPN